MRPPDLRAEPQREEHVDESNDDTKMGQACERIGRIRRNDLSEESIAFWKALEQVHNDGKRAASVPNLPHTKTIDDQSFTFDGCPKQLRPLLHDLMRFDRPLITWDIFNDAPPAEFRAPAVLQLAGLESTRDNALVQQAPAGGGADQVPAAITHRPGGDLEASGSGGRRLPTAIPPASTGAPSAPHLPKPTMKIFAHSTQLAGASTTTTPELRDPRVVNTVTHVGESKSKKARDEAEISFEAWTEAFAGRVESVTADRLYILRLADADGEFHLGLAASQGVVFDKRHAASRLVVPHIRALWFKRRNDARSAWGANPEFEHEEHENIDGKQRIEDELPTDSFLLEIEDSDLTDNSVEHKWTNPKFKQTLMRKLRWIAQEYNLQAKVPSAHDTLANKRHKGTPPPST